MTRLILIICLITSGTVRAEDTVLIEKEQKAPFAGILFSLPKANEIRGQLLERDLYKELSDSQQKTIQLYKSNNELSESKVNMLLEQNDKLSASLRSSQSLNTWECVGLFTLGILATVGAGLAIRSLNK